VNQPENRAYRGHTRGGKHLRPRKSLGQHFLRDQNITRKILTLLDPQPGDIVIEIGPGEGVLTRELVGRVRTLVAVEIDPRAVEQLRRELGPAVQILHQDVLKTDFRQISNRTGAVAGLRILGNIPYNITTPILFKILDERTVVRDAILMMQREVARRLLAAPGSKEYGIPSVFCRIFSSVEWLLDVPPTAFFPRPSVSSSVIRLQPLAQPRCTLNDEAFFRKMVRFVFGQRRKMLRNTLGALAAEYQAPLPEEFALTARPEQLTPEELVRLANDLYAKLGVGPNR
jgi:16S rRNA (adenine1518-N6/adenine1519-N6)-dimethyltransferase